jgi:hypothetical protein
VLEIESGLAKYYTNRANAYLSLERLGAFFGSSSGHVGAVNLEIGDLVPPIQFSPPSKNRWAEAAKDCDAALHLEPNNQKALVRRTLAIASIRYGAQAPGPVASLAMARGD